ncbi:OLC1v1019768C2 [Oldenlandia corymbosa var. corymbosa]|uniref:OLC1v1019768C2 n=1 Tax=Oldenlandia corymbosa var. corymbosa TaxID=529605 RepID=A0AAV1EF93_OLDCO|nr:OLC1v1019768C2 [Oldenlandia corymbosa var. corymbosa]
MGFVSFMGRVLFSSVFILSAWQGFNELDDPGRGQTGKLWAPKLAVLQTFLNSKLGEGSLDIDLLHIIVGTIALKALGGLLFVFGNTMGAYLLMFYLLLVIPLFDDFYNYQYGSPEFWEHLESFLQVCCLDATLPNMLYDGFLQCVD